MTDTISLPTPHAAARIAAFLAEHLSWSAFWDKREGVWRLGERPGLRVVRREPRRGRGDPVHDRELMTAAVRRAGS